MKKLAEKELKALAESVFESHPEAQVLYATEDGNMFLEKNKSMAYDHNRTVVKGSVLVIARQANAGGSDDSGLPENDDAAGAGASPKPNAKQLAKLMSEAETLEALEALLNQGETRTTVLDAYNQRKEFFNQTENK